MIPSVLAAQVRRGVEEFLLTTFPITNPFFAGRLEELLRTDGAVTITDLQARFGVSPMTARRDLTILSERGFARRTHGGAVLPSIVRRGRTNA